DLREINHIRSQLGLPPVDARLKEIGAAGDEDAGKAQPEPEEVPDHTEAREVYQADLKKVEELEVHRAYADQVARATAGGGQTPVRPLATMGTNGGPLLCDHCGKPIVLEGGRFHGVAADAAWRQNPRDGWTSYILGRNDNQCCNAAPREAKRARAE